jgi:hypothetical protein
MYLIPVLILPDRPARYPANLKTGYLAGYQIRYPMLSGYPVLAGYPVQAGFRISGRISTQHSNV